MFSFNSAEGSAIAVDVKIGYKKCFEGGLTVDGGYGTFIGLFISLGMAF